MKVILGKSIYEIKHDEFIAFLGVAKKLVKFGIYAAVKDGVCEMKNEIYDDQILLQQAVSEYEQQGFKVYCNK